MPIQLTVMSLDLERITEPVTTVYDTSELTFGRMPSNDVVLDRPEISAFHARLRLKRNDGDGSTGLYITDLGSNIGTMVENMTLPVDVETPIMPKQRIILGTYPIKPTVMEEEHREESPVTRPLGTRMMSSKQSNEEVRAEVSAEESVDMPAAESEAPTDAETRATPASPMPQGEEAPVPPAQAAAVTVTESEAVSQNPGGTESEAEEAVVPAPTAPQAPEPRPAATGPSSDTGSPRESALAGSLAATPRAPGADAPSPPAPAPQGRDEVLPNGAHRNTFHPSTENPPAPTLVPDEDTRDLSSSYAGGESITEPVTARRGTTIRSVRAEVQFIGEWRSVPKVSRLKELQDAKALLSMVEHIASSAVDARLEANEIPWAGIRISLAQSRGNVQRALDSM